ncbi:MAG: metallophosphatase family protein [Bacteroidales bacterium]|nr:metallophosphatase family protein [Bacteroidales bacterium]
MKTIGLLSDTHSHLDDKFYEFFAPCDMLWHAGDIGSLALADQLASYKPLVAVYGNIDDQKTRLAYPVEQRFAIEGADVYITHIGGYPGHYSAAAKAVLNSNPPKIFVCGHSHILRIMYDKKYNCLAMNPGAAGLYGFHHKRTAVRFKINKGEISDLEICELPKYNS